MTVREDDFSPLCVFKCVTDACSQPMINYCVEREEGGARRVVDLPDRLMSNFDKRA